jgi:hypothetical protein
VCTHFNWKLINPPTFHPGIQRLAKSRLSSIVYSNPRTHPKLIKLLAVRPACHRYMTQQTSLMPVAKEKSASVKSKAIKLVRSLSPESSWDDLMYQIYVRQKIEAGLADVRNGRVHAHSAIRKEFGLA